MARAVFLLLAGLAALMLAAAMTPLGPRLAKGAAESALSGALERDVAIGAVEGRWHDLTLRDIAVSDHTGSFLTIEQARLAWSPASAFSRNYRISSLAITEAALLRRPAPRGDDRPFRGLRLPTDLPDIAIGEFSITRLAISEKVAGRPSILSVSGSASIGGDRIDATLDLKSEDARDAIRLQAKTSAGRLSLDAEAHSNEDGVLAALARAQGPLALIARGEAPFNDFNARISGDIGAYGAIDAAVSTDLATLDRISFDGAFAPGARLASLKENAGERLRFDVVAKPEEDGGVATIERIEGAFGALEGDISWRNDARALNRADGALSVRLAQYWRPEFQRYGGGAIDARFAVAREDDRYRLTLDAKSDRGALTLKDAATDLKRALEGDIEAVLKSAGQISPFLSGDLALNGRVSIDDDEARLSGARLKDAASAFAGDIAMRIEDKSIDLVGDAEISAPAAARAIAGLQLSAPLRARIRARGGRAAFDAQIDAAAPGSTYRGHALAPLDIQLAASGAVSDFGGVLSARAKGAPGVFNARFARNEAGELSLDDIDYRGKSFRLAGAIRANSKSNAVAADLAYSGDKNAAPWPGLTLEGDARLTAQLARGRADNILTMRADRAAVRQWSLANVALDAKGPIGAMRAEATAANAQFNRLPPMTDAKSSLTADFDGAQAIIAERLSFFLAGTPARLSQPATLTWRDGAHIENFELKIGDGGVIRIDAAFAKQRWNGVATAKGFPLGDGAALLDLNANFDTDKPQAAAGEFLMRSQEINEASLAGRFLWDGAAITIADAGDAALDFEIMAPARLQRRPKISIGTKGPLLGRAAYQGPLEIVAPFLPSFAQSLNGALTVDARLAGSTDRPAITGDLSIRDGAYTDVVSGLVIVGIDANARAIGDAAGTRAEFSAAASGPGQKEKTISVEGSWRLDATDRLAAVIRLAGANIAAGPVTASRADGELMLSGSRRALTLAGELSASRLDAELKTQQRVGLVDVDVVALDRPAPMIADTAAPRAAPLAYDVRARARERAFIRGRGLISEWSADLSIVGDAANPLILGAMTQKEGTLDFSGRQFELTEGVLQFDRLKPNDPLVRIVAELESGDVDARIRIEGRASEPRITLDSTPARPTEDVVALVLFGKPAAELSAFESLQAAQALASLSAVGPFGGGSVAGIARKAIGLDLLSVDLDSDAGASSLTVGKYISDDVFVSARQDARGENGAIRIEFDVTRDITLETEVKQDGEQTVSANWKKDF
jgi:translocation and assembly module TamB